MTIIQQLEKRKKQLSHLNSPSNEEVYTPVALVEEMLDKLPKEIWTNPDLLWCDPCAKSGVFILEVIIRLMKSLPIEDETERHNHIINNMVKAYVNVKSNRWVVSKMIYGNTDSVEKVGLIEDINKIKIEEMPKFDVVVGNPPYQPPTKNRGKGKGSGAMLWPQFIKLSFEKITHEKSIISLITPSKWRLGKTASAAGNVANIMWKYKILCIENCTHKFNGIAAHQALDYWAFDKSQKNDEEYIFQKFHFFPLKNKELVKLFLSDVEVCDENDVFEWIGGNDYRHFKSIRQLKQGDKLHPYKHYNTFSQASEGIFDWYDKKTNGFADKKVIISNSVNLNTTGNKLAIYSDGNVGCGHNAGAYKVNNANEGKYLCNFLNNSIIIRSLIDEFNGPSGYTVPLKLMMKIPKSWVQRFNNGENL